MLLKKHQYINTDKVTAETRPTVTRITTRSTVNKYCMNVAQTDITKCTKMITAKLFRNLSTDGQTDEGTDMNYPSNHQHVNFSLTFFDHCYLEVIGIADRVK